MNETADLNDPIVTLNNVQETVPVSYCSRKERFVVLHRRGSGEIDNYTNDAVAVI